MRGGGLCQRILTRLGAVLACLAGCGDPPVCAREVSIVFQQTAITADVDDITPGVQSDIRIRTTLLEGEIVSLEIFSGDGAPRGAFSRPVNSDGDVVFHDVTVTMPRAILRATARGLCGEGSAEVTLDVLIR